MRKFLGSYLIILSILALVLSRVVGLGVAAILTMFVPDVNPIKDFGWLITDLFAITSLLLVFWSGAAQKIGFRKPNSSREWLLWIPALIFPILIMSAFHLNVQDGVTFLILALSAIGIAVNEEIIFRGLLLQGLLRFGSPVAIIGSAFLFGAIHLGNLIGGANLSFSIFQFGWAFIGGIAFAALVLRNRSIYPIIVFHFINDFTEYLATGENGVHQHAFSNVTLIIGLSLTVLFAIYGVWMFRLSKKTVEPIIPSVPAL